MSVYSHIEAKTEDAVRITLGYYQPLTDLITNIRGSFSNVETVLPEVIVVAEAAQEAVQKSGIWTLHCQIIVRCSVDDTPATTAKIIFGAVRDCTQSSDFIEQLSDSVPDFHCWGVIHEHPSDIAVDNRTWTRGLTFTVIASPIDPFGSSSSYSSDSSSSRSSCSSSSTSRLS